MRPSTRLRADASANQIALRRPRYERDLSGPRGRRQPTAPAGDALREEYERLMAAPAEVERALRRGAAKAREVSVPYLAEIRRSIGVQRLGGQS